MTHDDRQRIGAALRVARASTTAHLELTVVDDEKVEPLDRALEHLYSRKLHERSGRDAVVFYVAPNARRFAVLGDNEVHAKVGERYWAALADDIATRFAYGSVPDAIVFGIERIGRMLATAFPAHVKG